MPTASVAAAVSTAVPLTIASSRFGMNSITSTPTIGKNVPRLSSHCWFWSTSMRVPLAVDEYEYEGTDRC